MNHGPDQSWMATEDDRRDRPRRRQIKFAQAIYRNGNSSLDCEVRNLSDTGAQLRLPTLIDLPDAFSLHLQDGRKRSVEVVWRRGDRLGVRFVDLPATVMVHAAPVDATLLERIARIERELVELRRELVRSRR